MGRGRELTAEQIEVVELNLLQGKSKREVARIIGKSEKCIRNYVMRKTTAQLSNRGSKQKVSALVQRAIWRAASNRAVSCRSLIEEFKLNVSLSTMYRILRKSPYLHYKRKLRKPPLSTAHRQHRVNWCVQRLAWTLDWRTYIFSDEKKFNLDGPDGWAFYWHDTRKDEVHFRRLQQGGTSVMVWGAIGWNGKSNLAFVAGRMNSTAYTNVLRDYLLPCMQTIAVAPVIFQQDNAPIHKSLHSMGWLGAHQISTVDWPARSPDLNPIENLWSTLARAVYKENRQYNDVQSLKEAIISAWNAIPQEDVQRLYISMSKRVMDVIRVNGSNIPY